MHSRRLPWSCNGALSTCVHYGPILSHLGTRQAITALLVEFAGLSSRPTLANPCAADVIAPEGSSGRANPSSVGDDNDKPHSVVRIPTPIRRVPILDRTHVQCSNTTAACLSAVSS